MKHWKYFYLNDIKKEAIGTLYAEDEGEAYTIASRMKKLNIISFRDIFKVEQL